MNAMTTMIPFAPPQTITLNLKTGQTAAIRYSPATNTCTVAGVTRAVGEKFVLDGQIAVFVDA